MPARTPKHARASVNRAAAVAVDQRQIEMEFADQTELELENPTDHDMAQVEEAVGDLDRLEREITESSGPAGEQVQKVTSS